MTRRRTDLAAAGAFGVLAVVFLWSGRALTFTTATGVPGPGFFPLLIAAATLALAATLAVQALRRREGRREAPDAQTQGAEERVSSVRTLAVWGVVFAAAVGLPVIGFVPAMFLLSAGVLFGVERRFDPLSIASAVLLPLLTYLLFGVLLDVRLPAGPFG